MTEQPRRYARLDEIRGLAMLSMLLYHFLWDLAYIAGIDIPWYRGTPGYLWQQSICMTFIFLSGFCQTLGRHPLRRGLTVFLAGGLVTAVTLLFVPENRVIFGVLTLLGSSMLLLIPLDRLFALIRSKGLLAVGLAVCLICFILLKDVNDGYIPPCPIGGRQLALPAGLYSGWLSTYLGFPMQGFYSTDYFSLVPWFFLFLVGYFCHRVLFFQGTADPRADRFLRAGTLPAAGILGRHSLLIYLLHQPVLYGLTLMLQLLFAQPS